jgi:geranylgeranyl diphosphate synthase type I
VTQLQSLPPDPAPRGAGNVIPLVRPAAAGARLARQTKSFLRRVDSRLAEVVHRLVQTWRHDLFAETDPGADSLAPMDILLDRDLPEMLRVLTVTGGKRIRPSMCFWGWVAAGGRARDSGDHVVQAGAALELLHIFALIHDDVMDESASRRGRPSVHALAAQLHLHSAARAARAGSGRASPSWSATWRTQRPTT